MHRTSDKSRLVPVVKAGRAFDVVKNIPANQQVSNDMRLTDVKNDMADQESR
jgi:hypothetical protein